MEILKPVNTFNLLNIDRTEKIDLSSLLHYYCATCCI